MVFCFLLRYTPGRSRWNLRIDHYSRKENHLPNHHLSGSMLLFGGVCFSFCFGFGWLTHVLLDLFDSPKRLRPTPGTLTSWEGQERKPQRVGNPTAKPEGRNEKKKACKYNLI